MFGWFKKKNRPISHLPSVFMEVDSMNGDIMISTRWPKPANDDELVAIVKSYVMLLILLSNSKLCAAFQNAISLHGHNHDDENTARAILIGYNSALEAMIDHKQISERIPAGKPLVSPRQVFNRG